MNSFKELLNAIENNESVKRLNQLESYIDSNNNLKKTFDELLIIQKQMINCKHLNFLKAYDQYKKEYDSKKEEFLSNFYVEEYLELLEEGHQIVKNIIDIIEVEISKDFL